MEQSKKEILDIIKSMQLYPDMLDIWQDKAGNISLEPRGMQPAGNMVNKKIYIGFVDNGSVFFE